MLVYGILVCASFPLNAGRFSALFLSELLVVVLCESSSLVDNSLLSVCWLYNFHLFAVIILQVVKGIMKYRFRNSRDFVTNECGKKLKKSEMRKYYYRFHCDIIHRSIKRKKNSSCSAKYDTAEVAMFFPAEGGGGYMPLPLTDGRCFTGRPQHQIMHNLASLDTGGRSFKNFIRCS
ncbi:conserved hypothetical protein [Trichinella spiralis]|uniref:hypothetical protein n=1 Tax=Trichinella spiralis TaxID=6334 RepID=UPI0001EFCDE5|nr:conserved hypothetical protein [Trichinella spiralis]